MRGAPWASGGWGAAQSLQWSRLWEESRAAPRWMGVPPGRAASTASPSKLALLASPACGNAQGLLFLWKETQRSGSYPSEFAC